MSGEFLTENTVGEFLSGEFFGEFLAENPVGEFLTERGEFLSGEFLSGEFLVGRVFVRTPCESVWVIVCVDGCGYNSLCGWVSV